jgi:hypothetical protein
MKRLGVFVTPEELETVLTAQSVSGMFLSGGRPMGDPAREVKLLIEKYKMPEDAGLDAATGEFVRRES